MTCTVLSALALSMTLAGCGGNVQNGTSSGETKPVTLTYWSMWNKGEPQQIVMQNIINEFEKQYPNIHVTVQWAGRQLLPKVQQTLISGNVPDLIDKDEQEIAASLVESNQATPLDSILNRTIQGENNTINQVIPKQPLHFYDNNGHTYIIPYELIASGIWYNGSLFQKYNLAPPKTWSDFLQVATKLKSLGVAPVAADGTIDFYNAYWFYWLSDRILGPGAFLKAAGDKSGNAWSNPKFLEAAQDVHNLVANDVISGYQGSKWPAGQVSWAQGKAAMLLMGSWAPSETHTYAAQGFQYQMFPFPVVDPSVSPETDAETYLIGWSIPKGAEHIDAADKFILFALNKSHLEGISTIAQNIPARMDIPAPANLKTAQDLFKGATNYHAVYDGVQSQYADYWQTVFLTLDNKLFFNQISPQDFISQMEQKSKEYWSTH